MNTPLRSCPGFPVTLSRPKVGAPVRGTRLRLIVLLLALALPSAVRAQFTYTINNGTVTITRYVSFDDTAIIPPAIGGLPVTGIAEGAFGGIWGLVSVCSTAASYSPQNTNYLP